MYAADKTLCTLPEPHDHIFYVPNELSGKECICPFTGVEFFAPDLAAAAAEAKARLWEQARGPRQPWGWGWSDRCGD